MKKNVIIHGNCLNVMTNIPDKSIDMILCDLPYGTTACKWDVIIPFKPLWKQYKRIIKDNGAIALFGSQPFTSMLVMSNSKMFKYEWIWKKSKPNGWQHAANQPMKTTENISVFSKGSMGHKSLLGSKRMTYFPQGVRNNGKFIVKSYTHGKTMGDRPKQVGKICNSKTGFPSNFLEYPNVIGKKAIHPTQKPVALFEYLIKTYTNEGELVLDNCIGSGTTAIACINTKRDYIGIEKELEYVKVTKKRIKNYLKTIALLVD